MYIKIPDNSNLIPKLDRNERLRIVEWLIDNTFLTKKHIAKLSNIAEYTVHRIFEDELKLPFLPCNPVEKGYIKQELLDFLQNTKILDAPDHENILASLEIAAYEDLKDNLIFSVKLVKAYFLSYGHNAWYGTWSSRYMSNKSIHLTLEGAKKEAERHRVQGRVFTISEIPTLCFYTKEKLIFVSGINDNETEPFKRIYFDNIDSFVQELEWKNMIAKYPQFIISSYSDLLYLKEIDATDQFKRYTSESQGAGYCLCFYSKNIDVKMSFLEETYINLIDILKKENLSD